MMTYDPLELSEKAKELVVKGNKRLYYRFRVTRFYGGIVTGDVCGCNLRCRFCWSWNKIVNPKKYGKLYVPEQVKDEFRKLVEKSGYQQVRLSGGEPTMSKAHLLQLLDLIPDRWRFVLETNGILIDESYARELSEFDNLYVRVSLKGCTKQEFSKLTGADPEAFGLQLRSLENLVKHNVPSHPAVMMSFSEKETIKELRKKVEEMDPGLRIEYEKVKLYPPVRERLKKSGLI